ncbi:MAG: M6 family metalloprotease domain-containing protein [Phycisphaerae bacterium]|jgi:M6 family metalloprotease-like protein
MNLRGLFGLTIGTCAIIALASLTVTPTAEGAPVFGEVMSVRQPDGSFVDVRIWGDEFYGVTETLDGYTLVRDPQTRFLCYAKLSEDGNELISTGIRATKSLPRGLDVQTHLRIEPASSRAKALAARARYEERNKALRGGATAAVAPTTGAVQGITIIVDFPDEAGTITANEVNNYCNQLGYSNFGNNGSIRDYFLDVSGGLLDYTNFVPANYITVSNNKSYYTDESVSWGTRASEMVEEALDAIDAGGFDFSTLDADSDGVVDAVNVFYVGFHGNNWAEGLWPGALGISWSADGVDVERYQMTNMGNSLTIATFCHENGHLVMGWPDLYDYDFDSAGIGAFGLMCNTGSGTNPVQPCAEMKLRAGWATLIDIPCDQDIEERSDDNTFYIWRNPGDPLQYILIENRQQIGRDTAIPDAGLAIWLNDRAGNNSNQQMTAASHYEVTLLQADGDWDLELNQNQGDGSDLFSAPDLTQILPTGNPNTDWWDGSNSNLSVRDVSTPGVLMTFDACDCTQCEKPPAIVFPATDRVVECNGSGNTAELNDWLANNGGATAVSYCDGEVDWTNNYDPANGVEGCGETGHITVTFAATDVCGQVAVTTATFTIVDTTDPFITVFPANVGFDCYGSVPKPNPNLISSSDACGDTEATWEGDTKNNGSGCPGDPLVIHRTYRVTDECGNYVERIQQYNIVDDVPPTFTEFPEDQNLQCVTEVPEPDLNLVEADDNCFGPVEVTWEGDADNGGAGCADDPRIITRTYRATDMCGNITERNQTFTIIDDEDPTIECSITNDPQPIGVNADCEAYVEFSVTVTNNCCVDPADIVVEAVVLTGNASIGPVEFDPFPEIGPSVTITGRVKVYDLICCPATVEITAYATDCCGNPTPRCAEIVDVIDNYPPAGACGLTHDHRGWNWIDNMIDLTANEPTYWSALSGLPKGTGPFDTLDPGWLPGRPDPDSEESGDRVLRGFVVAWAVNEFGEEIRWNHLKGDAVLVNYRQGSAWEYNAYAFQANNVAQGAPTGTPGVMYLDGTEYETCFDQLLFDFYAVGATLQAGNALPFSVNTDLTLMPVDMDLRQDTVGPVTTKAKFDIWNMNEFKFSGTERCITCWDQTLLYNYDTPNQFLLRALQTDKGRARIDGLGSDVCDGSVDTPLLGLAMKMLVFAKGAGVAQSGVNLVGGGQQGATIEVDVLGEPPKARRSDIRTNKAAAACPQPVSAVEKGSLLIFPKVEIRWDWCGNLIQDTFIDLSNDYPLDVQVQMYFVNGDPPADAALPRCIAPDGRQPADPTD